MTLYLIRHSAVDIDYDRPAHEWLLSANGRFLAQQLATQLTPPPSRIYTSDEPKADETGQLIAAELGIDCGMVEGLHEHRRATVPYFANKAEFEAKVAEFFARPDELCFGEETAVVAFTRFNQAIKQLKDNNPQPIAVVTHGTVMTLFICHHNPHLNPFSFWQQLALPDCYLLDAHNRLLTIPVKKAQ